MKKHILYFSLLFLSVVQIYGQSALWNEYEGTTPRGQGSTIANYSYAGYHYCEKELPTVNETNYTYFNVLDYGAVPDDGLSDRAAVVKTIDAAQKHNGNAVVYFPEGRFNLNGKEDFGQYPIVITKSGTVIKGAGQDVTELYFDQPAFLNSEPFIKVTPSYPNTSYWRGDEKLGDVLSYPEKGGFFLNVTNGSKFLPGMAVNIDADLHTRSERGKGYFLPHDPPEGVDDREDYLMEMHIVDKVEGNTVYFKEPIHLDLPHMQDAIIRSVKKIIEEVGVEDLTLSGNYREQFKHHNGSRFGERYDMLVIKDARYCWVRNVRIKNYSSAIQVNRTMASSFFNINLIGHTGHNCVGGTHSNGNLYMYMRENTQTHHGFGGDHCFVGSVFCRCNQFDGPEAHCAWPRASLYDMNMGGFKPRPGGAKKFPHHGTDLCFWNWNVSKSGTKDYWPDGENYGYFIPPVIVGLHGESFTIPDKDTDLLAYESLGTKEAEIESLFESQLADRLGAVPTWLKAMSETFEATSRHAKISITSPSKFSSVSTGQGLQIALKSPEKFDQAKVRKVEIHASKIAIYGGFEKVAEAQGWNDEITIQTTKKGSVVLKALMFYGDSELEESLPITIFIGDPANLKRLEVKKAAMLPRDTRNALYGQFTAIGGAEASSFPENNAYTKYKDGSLFYTVEQAFYEDQLKTYAKFGKEKVKPELEKSAFVTEVNKLIDNNASSTIGNIYGNSMLQFDLGAEFSLGKIELVWKSAASANVSLEVQTSSDSMAWYSFVNDEPLWEFGVQQIGETLSSETLPNASVVPIYIPQKRCRYVRFSTKGFSNGRLAEVRFYGSGIPLLESLSVNGAIPYDWNAEKMNYEITVKEGQEILINGKARSGGSTINIIEPIVYPGEALVRVMDESGARTEYSVNIFVAGTNVEDFEKASSGSYSGIFVGNNNIEWEAEGRFSSSMGTGQCIYFYPTQTGLQSQVLSGGLSELSFDAENLTRSGSIILRVSVNDSVIIDSLYSEMGVLDIKKNDLNFLGDVILKIENLTVEKKKLGIDNIRWKGLAPDRNAYLKSIEVYGENIPAFRRDSAHYIIKWIEGEMNIIATPESEDAEVMILVNRMVPPTAEIKVTAANGDWSRYTVAFDKYLGSPNKPIKKLVVYPNPAKEVLYVQGFGADVPHSYSLYDIAGSRLRHQMVESNIQLEIFRNDLNKGIYILKVEMQNQTIYQGTVMFM